MVGSQPILQFNIPRQKIPLEKWKHPGQKISQNWQLWDRLVSQCKASLLPDEHGSTQA